MKHNVKFFHDADEGMWFINIDGSTASFEILSDEDIDNMARMDKAEQATEQEFVDEAMKDVNSLLDFEN